MPSPTVWNKQQLRDPHADADKASRVRRMFAAIAPKYDLNNRLHSFGRDQAWRRAAVRMAGLKPGDRVLDVACGTGDLTLAFAAALHRLDPASDPRVLGVDFTYEMLPLAREKAGRPADTERFTRYVQGDAQALPVPDASFDVVSIAFGIRNVADPARALAEFRRVLRPGGRLIVLEFAEPSNPLVCIADRLYRCRIMPLTASLIAGDRTGAYRYLPQSVQTFMSRPEMKAAITEAGFGAVVDKALTFGVAVVYRGEVSA